MAHYAFLDENNIVTEVIVGKDESELLDGLSPEEWYGRFRGQKCVRTSYNNKIRKRYAGKGYWYNEELDAFIPPKPFDSWILDNNTADWTAPVPNPNEKTHFWNEQNKEWVKIFSIGFPKSGNHFLNFSNHILNNKPLSVINHNESLFDEVDSIVTPFRNPIDAISAWSDNPTEQDVSWYINFYQKAIDNKEKVIFADFDKFTTNKDYLLTVCGAQESELSLDDIKMSMSESGLWTYLPQENTDRSAIKQIVENLPNYNQAVDMYNQLLTL